MGISVFTSIFGIFLCSIQMVRMSPIVQTNDSYIQGSTINFMGHGVNQYLGIPYAQPPVGPLRFKKPAPLSSNSTVIQAVTNPPACPQYTEQPYPWYVNSTEKSEDCLHLNIWTPADASPTNKKAVMYWMHGGGFRYGSIRDKLYSGVALASLGDIIVVTVNYRLGAFGFFTSGTDDAPANVGLYDSLEGLKWVNEHIEAFGGDLGRITISGESAGAISVAIFTISPLAKGLYSRLIMESGSPITRLVDNNKQNIKLAQQLAESLKCANETYTIIEHPKEVVQCLRGVDAVTLSQADYPLAPHATADFMPQYGDELFPNNPRTSILSGDFTCADLLIGNNKDEGSLVLTTSAPEVYGFFGKKNAHLNRTSAEGAIRSEVGDSPAQQSVVDQYLPANLMDDSHNKLKRQVYTALGDLMILCPTMYYAEECAKQRQNVYYYFFTHRPSVTPWARWMGSAHFEEVQFVFGQPLLNPKKYRKSERKLSRQMIGIWSSFVKYGKPNISWPLYSRENRTFKFLGPKYVTGKNGANGPHGKNCDILRLLT